MMGTSQSAVLILATLELLFTVGLCDVANVLSMNFTHKLGPGRSSKHLVSTSVLNFEPQYNYFLTAEIGTPPQINDLLLDTGSSDTFVLVPGHCKNVFYQHCEGGTYDKAKSSTYKDLKKFGKFHTSFGNGNSKIKGSWFEDSFRFGGITVKNFIMGLGSKNDPHHPNDQQWTGLVGLGFPNLETYYPWRRKHGPYPNLPVKLKEDGHIRSKVFSVFLDDAAAHTGKVLFGGYDTAQFEGELKMFPYLQTYRGYPVQEYAVPFTSVGVTRGSESRVYMDSFDVVAGVLDTGTPSIELPEKQYDEVVKALPHSSEFHDHPYHMDCSIGELHASVDFGFGEGEDRMIIPVPIAELVNPSYTADGSRKRDQEGKYVCESALQRVKSVRKVYLGRQFIRNAYALFDLENKAGGLAPAKRDPHNSNVIEYDPHGPNYRINRAGLHEKVATLTRTKNFVTTVHANPAKDTSYIKSYQSLPTRDVASAAEPTVRPGVLTFLRR